MVRFPMATSLGRSIRIKPWILIVLCSLIFFFPRLRASADETSYRIGPGDFLEISVWKDETLSRQILVPPDGMISFPLIGDLDAKHLTVSLLREAIVKRLGEYVPDPTVTVMLLKPDSMRAYVIGKVNSPGVFPISLDTNVMQILAMAGGLNPFAASNRIILLRKEGGATLKLPFEYSKVEKGENLEQNVLLKRGDVVVVP